MTTVSVHARRPDGSDAGELGSWVSLDVVERWRDVGTWVVELDDPAEAGLFTRGSGVVVRRGDTILASGRVAGRRVEQRGPAQVTTVSGFDDSLMLARTRVWPLPGAAIESQAEAYDVRSGVAESVMLGFASANMVTRLGRAVVMPADLGRGSQVTVRGRFQSLLEVFREAAAGSPTLGWRMVQQVSERAVALQVWEASDLTDAGGVFSDLVGNVSAWVWSEQYPETTRVVVAGGDEGAARMLRQVTDSAVESQWVCVWEDFQDRRDVDPSDATAEQELLDAGAKTLTEKGPAVSLRVQVEDVAPGLEYGVDYRVGDLVSVYPAGLAVQDRITEATVRVTRQDGERVGVWVGRREDDPDERVESRARDLMERMRALERIY